MSGSTVPTTFDVRSRRLFLGSCLALIATSVTFAVIGAVMGSLKQAFVLTNLEVGWIGGAALWGFAVSQVIFSPLCDSLGMRSLLRLAFVGHVAGALTMITADGFTGLFAGALILSLGNGLVEAACNPLVAALYPHDKTVKLNQFHVWFPGGIVIGGVSAFLLDQVGLTAWQLKIGLILVPTLLYGVLILRERFPATEGVQAGVSVREMFRVTLTSPLMWLLLFCMAITASTELGPGRWIPAVLESVGIPGILVLAWINGLMAAMRYKAGFAVHRFSPIGVLFLSSVIALLGLWLLSRASSLTAALGAATVFAIGVCYFWPTLLGVASERVPRSGALGLGLLGAVGTAVAGLIAIPWMGQVADEKGHDRIPVVETVALLEEVERQYANPALALAAARQDLERAREQARRVLSHYRRTGELSAGETANSLRAVMQSGSEGNLPERAGAILGPADNYGGRQSFRALMPFTAVLVLVFGILYFNDRRTGGYRVVHLERKASAA